MKCSCHGTFKVFNSSFSHPSLPFSLLSSLSSSISASLSTPHSPPLLSSVFFSLCTSSLLSVYYSSHPSISHLAFSWLVLLPHPHPPLSCLSLTLSLSSICQPSVPPHPLSISRSLSPSSVPPHPPSWPRLCRLRHEACHVTLNKRPSSQ